MRYGIRIKTFATLCIYRPKWKFPPFSLEHFQFQNNYRDLVMDMVRMGFCFHEIILYMPMHYTAFFTAVEIDYFQMKTVM